MKLTVEHLSVYLPYGLKVLSDELHKGKAYQMVASNNTTSFANGLTIQDVFTMNAKPLLKTKNHLHNLQDEIFIRWGGGVSKVPKAIWIKEVTDNMLYTAYPALRYDEILFMAEHHIDIFNLIQQGLAIEKA